MKTDKLVFDCWSELAADAERGRDCYNLFPAGALAQKGFVVAARNSSLSCPSCAKATTRPRARRARARFGITKARKDTNPVASHPFSGPANLTHIGAFIKNNHKVPKSKAMTAFPGRALWNCLFSMGYLTWHH